MWSSNCSGAYSISSSAGYGGPKNSPTSVLVSTLLPSFQAKRYAPKCCIAEAMSRTIRICQTCITRKHPFKHDSTESMTNSCITISLTLPAANVALGRAEPGICMPYSRGWPLIRSPFVSPWVAGFMLHALGDPVYGAQIQPKSSRLLLHS